MRRTFVTSRRAGRILRRPAFAVASSATALLLFCWPFLRVPRPSMVETYLHLFGAWALVIVVLLGMALVGGGAGEGGDDRA